MIIPHTRSEQAVKCPVCGQSTNILLTEKFRKGPGLVYYCEPCDMGFQPDYESLDLEAYYKTEYRKEISHQSEGGNTHAKEIFDTYMPYQGDRLPMILPHLNETSKLLEVGASAGQFIHHALTKTNQVSALELDVDCIHFLKEKFRDIDISGELLNNSAFAKNKYDVVCSFQVMEHTESPLDFLRDLKNVTSKGGKVFVEVPNLYDPLLALWNVPTYHSFYYHKAHLFYFSKTSLEIIAEQAGYRKDQIKVLPTQDYNIMNQLHWIMNNGPQPDCHIGLSECKVDGKDPEISEWLSKKLQELNSEYIEHLKSKYLTSNLMMVLSHDS